MKKGPLLIGETVIVEDGCNIGDDVEIRSNYIHIKKNSTIKELKAHTPDKFIMGECGYIGNGNEIKCRSFVAGDYLRLTDDVTIGGGGNQGPNSLFSIGSYCMVCEGVYINTSESVTIGDDVGIGAGVQIWTHGSYLDVLSGYPANFQDVVVGSHVWLPTRIVILPGITIGDHVVVGLGSLINKNIPGGSLAAGMPVKILKENMFPKPVDAEKRSSIIRELIGIWKDDLMAFKGIDSVVSIEYIEEGNFIKFVQNNGETKFHVDTRTIEGLQDRVTEDFRDFIRRRGLKFFNGERFTSITPIIFREK